MPKRLQVALSHALHKGSILVYDQLDWDRLLTKVMAKLQLKKKSAIRIFFRNGVELSTDYPLETLANDEFLIFTTGSLYTPPGGRLNPTEPSRIAREGGAAPARVCVIADRSLVEDEAVRQLRATALLPGMRHAVGLPDLHPGKGHPIGAAFASHGVIYPYLIGGDIGCGMSFLKLPVARSRLSSDKKRDRWAESLSDLDAPWTGGDAEEWLKKPLCWGGTHTTTAVVDPDHPAFGFYDIDVRRFHDSLGTIGAGNHFAELQCVEEVVDEDAFQAMGLDREALYLLVHSGSRGLGAAVLESYTERRRGGSSGEGLSVEDEEAAMYLSVHDQAMAWARRNRALIAHRFMEAIGLATDDDAVKGFNAVLDVFHNFVERKGFHVEEEGGGEEAVAACDRKASSSDHPPIITEPLMLHRKGAAPSDAGCVIIPGSRGHMSYLCQPLEGPQQEAAAFSLAHGAGRKWHRGKAASLMKERYPKASTLEVTELQSRVVCDDKALLYEEAPQAYKEITDVIADLEDRGLIRVVAVMRPVITYKKRSRDSAAGGGGS